MNLSSLMIRLEAWIQEELGSQARMIELLDAQEKAIVVGDGPRLIELGEEMDEELGAKPGKSRNRTALLAGFGSAWSVLPETLTLSSIADRCEQEGLSAERLRALRNELRSSTAELLKIGRRIVSLAKYHQGLLSELRGTLFTDLEERVPGTDAHLIDARG
jgi:hypothetical protein